MSMEIRVLRYFLTVVREESITRASEVLHITQPTLSHQLAQLEEELGVKLFDRGTRKIRLTNEGILLRRRAEEILQLVDKTEKELVEQVEGKISIGCGEATAVQLLPELIDAFRQKYPRVTFDIFTATADLVKELNVVFTSNLSANSAVMVNGGRAYSLVIEGAMPFWDQSKITYRPLVPPLTTTSVLAWKRGQPFSLAATKFIEHIQCSLSIGKP